MVRFPGPRLSRGPASPGPHEGLINARWRLSGTQSATSRPLGSTCPTPRLTAGAHVREDQERNRLVLDFGSGAGNPQRTRPVHRRGSGVLQGESRPRPGGHAHLVSMATRYPGQQLCYIRSVGVRLPPGTVTCHLPLLFTGRAAATGRSERQQHDGLKGETRVSRIPGRLMVGVLTGSGCLHADERPDRGGVDLTHGPGHQALSGHQVVIQTLQAPV